MGRRPNTHPDYWQCRKPTWIHPLFDRTCPDSRAIELSPGELDSFLRLFNYYKAELEKVRGSRESILFGVTHWLWGRGLMVAPEDRAWYLTVGIRKMARDYGHQYTDLDVLRAILHYRDPASLQAFRSWLTLCVMKRL